MCMTDILCKFLSDASRISSFFFFERIDIQIRTGYVRMYKILQRPRNPNSQSPRGGNHTKYSYVLRCTWIGVIKKQKKNRTPRFSGEKAKNQGLPLSKVEQSQTWGIHVKISGRHSGGKSRGRTVYFAADLQQGERQSFLSRGSCGEGF